MEYNSAIRKDKYCLLIQHEWNQSHGKLNKLGKRQIPDDLTHTWLIKKTRKLTYENEVLHCDHRVEIIKEYSGEWAENGQSETDISTLVWYRYVGPWKM